jgi:ATP-dependent helicase HrpB
VAQRREAGSANLLLASGRGAMLAHESGVHGGEFLVALDIHQSTATQATARSQSGSTESIPNRHAVRNQAASRNPQSAMAMVRLASLVDREWLAPTASEVVHRFESSSGKVRAFAIDRYGALTLAERAVPVDPEIAASLLAEAWLERGPDDSDAQLIRRLAFAGHHPDVPALVRTAASGAPSLTAIRIANAVAADLAQTLDRDAPQFIRVPSGRQLRLEYNADGSVSAAVKLQDLFGMADTPRVGRRREPVVLSLLAPNGRPVQVTRDLRSFWDRTYPEVRKELRGRYPKHRWPEDPWTAGRSEVKSEK